MKTLLKGFKRRGAWFVAAVLLVLFCRGARAQTVVTDYASFLNALGVSSAITTFLTNSTTGLTEINLTSAQQTIPITKNVLIDGGSNGVVFNGNGVARIFMVASNCQLTLNNVQLINGVSTNGGAIYNAGALIISNCLISGNAATNISGANGASNDSGGPGGSGGNGGTAEGGAIYSRGPVSIYYSMLGTNSSIAGNGGNGGNGGDGLLFGGDGGNGGNGGSAYGAAIYSVGASNVFVSTEFVGNICAAGVAGIAGVAGSAEFGGNDGKAGSAGSGAGGAVYVTGPVFMTNCLFALNALSAGSGPAQGGGLYIPGTVARAYLENSVFFNNSCTSLGGPAAGAGIFSAAPLVTMRNCTLATNTLSVTTNSGGPAAGWDLCRTAGVLKLSGSILSGGTNYSAGTNISGVTNVAMNSKPNASGVTDAGYNICSDASLTRASTNTLINTDPALASELTGLGGPAIGPPGLLNPLSFLKLAVLASSPAIGFVPGVPGLSFPATDELGNLRGTPACAGACELTPLTTNTTALPPIVVPITLPTNQLADAGRTVTLTVSATPAVITNISIATTLSVVTTNNPSTAATTSTGNGPPPIPSSPAPTVTMGIFIAATNISIIPPNYSRFAATNSTIATNGSTVTANTSIVTTNGSLYPATNSAVTTNESTVTATTYIVTTNESLYQAINTVTFNYTNSGATNIFTGATNSFTVTTNISIIIATNNSFIVSSNIAIVPTNDFAAITNYSTIASNASAVTTNYFIVTTNGSLYTAANFTVTNGDGSVTTGSFTTTTNIIIDTVASTFTSANSNTLFNIVNSIAISNIFVVPANDSSTVTNYSVVASTNTSIVYAASVTVVANSANLGYQWQLDGTNLPANKTFMGTATSNLTIKNLTAADEGQYQVIVSAPEFAGASFVEFETNIVFSLSLRNPAKITVPPASKLNVPPGSVVAFKVGATGSPPLSFQWHLGSQLLADANGISGSATSNLTINPVTTNDSGEYFVVVTNAYGKATNKSPAVLSVTPDVAKPRVAFTSPASGARTNNLIVTGTASDNAQVVQVHYWITNLNAGNNPPVTITSNPGIATLGTNGTTAKTWTITNAPLLPGTNYIAVQAVDYSGNKSAFATRQFFYKVTNQFALWTNGPGGITGKASVAGDVRPANGALLNIGEGYTLTAAPDKAYVLTNWTGTNATTNFTSNALTLHFIMESNLAVTANFTTNLFIGASGTYNGLFYPTNGVTEQSGGMLYNLALHSNGTYSATLLLGGASYAIAGSFDTSGAAGAGVKRATAKGGPVSVAMTLDWTNGEIAGSVSNAAWVSVLDAEKSAVSTNSAEYTVLLAPGTNAMGEIPPGYGYILITNRRGSVSLSGALADGSAFSQAVPAGVLGYVPVFNDKLYGGAGLFLGWLNISNGAVEAEGPMAWIKPAVKSGIYINGFTNDLMGSGSVWTNPAAVSANSLNISNASFALDYAVSITDDVVVKSSNNVPMNTLTGKIAPKTGLVTITFGNGAGKATTIGYAAILQDTTNGGGYFLTKTNAGVILLTNTPP